LTKNGPISCIAPPREEQPGPEISQYLFFSCKEYLAIKLSSICFFRDIFAKYAKGRITCDYLRPAAKEPKYEIYILMK